MLVDLVQVTTRDGFRLDGAYQAPTAAPCCRSTLCGLVHGTGGNFYTSSLFDALAERLRALGCGVLRVNTAATMVSAPRPPSAAAADRVRPMKSPTSAGMICGLAGLAAAAGGVARRTAGHSFGAVKALYALAHEPDQTCVCVVALSPPRLSYSAFCNSAHAQLFLETYHRAEALVQQGQAASLIEVTLPLPYAISARATSRSMGRTSATTSCGSCQVPCPVC